MILTDVTPEADKAVRQYLSVAGKQWELGIAAYALYMTEQEDHPFYGGYLKGSAPCHHYLRDLYASDVILVNAMNKKKAKGYEDFILWVCRESPYAYAVLNKDNEDELINNGMVVDLRLCGKGGALWLCKAIRMLQERPDKAANWRLLLAEGVDPLWAFVGASMLTAAGNPEPGGHHCSLFSYSSPEIVYSHVEELKKGEKNETSHTKLDQLYPIDIWGSIGSKTVREPDGWGGYNERQVPGDPAGYAELIKRIATEGTLTNVKTKPAR